MLIKTKKIYIYIFIKTLKKIPIKNKEKLEKKKQHEHCDLTCQTCDLDYKLNGAEQFSLKFIFNLYIKLKTKKT